MRRLGTYLKNQSIGFISKNYGRNGWEDIAKKIPQIFLNFIQISQKRHILHNTQRNWIKKLIAQFIKKRS
jgi:hypothetical protein